MHVPVALVGTTLPAVNLTIKPSELRGVASNGMICSLQELGLPSGVDGIAILEDLLETVPPLGAPIGPALGLDDAVRASESLAECGVAGTKPGAIACV